MKKVFVSMLATLLALTTLTACRGTGEKTQTSDAATTAPVDVSAELSDEPITEYNTLDVGSWLKYSDRYLYFYVGSSYDRNDSKETLYRYNTQTGSLTTVCPDPLCQHNDKECPFYSLDLQYAVYNNIIVYDRLFWLSADIGDGEMYYENVKYDLQKNKLTVYSSTKGYKDVMYDTELYTDHYRFFYDIVKDTETGEQYLNLCRMNLDNGTVTALRDSDFGKGLTLTSHMLFAVDNKLYFSDGKEIFYTDFDLQGKQTVMSGSFHTDFILTDGTYMFFGEKETEGSNVLTLYRANLDGSGKTSLNIQAYSFRLTENYIYYNNLERYTLGEDKRTGTIGGELTGAGTALCRAAHDGSGQEEVFSYWQGDTFYIPSSPPIYVDNKIYTLYSTYTDADHDGAIRDDEYFQSHDREHYTILCVDLTTGEMDYIYCGTEPQTTP